ncbi:MAG: Gfo/Idh/MocA family oxidoreductase [Kiritimatiellae bacterium]|nr:Gfo/Idh/MocA family oxidoreductase [Kiritimatiellia bacterium]
MSFKLGLVGLCTSHPGSWVPIIRDLAQEGLVDVEVVAAWDSGETRPAGFAAEFCAKFEIPRAVQQMEEMVPLVDGVIVHTTNWDRHVEQARPFVEADKAVLIDKPLVGNLRDANQLLHWAKQGKRITGGSSLRYAGEVRDFLAEPVEARGTLHTAHSSCGVDEFNYGIHAYSLLCGLMGPGARSVRYLGASGQKQIMVQWQDGRIGFLTVGKNAWLPSNFMAVTDKAARQVTVETKGVYRALLEAQLPYLTGKTDRPPTPLEDLLEAELTAIAARMSWLNHGAEVCLSDLRQDDPGYDGTQFATEYARARIEAK